ncbi:EamA family transporter [Corallococcus exercitus]|uniref:DMT family transporter n=1 Tax=Corallococcus exercitus TaxID=2316736 RepID=UPI000EA32A91|nr:DMT family transporter [Corallococcus exercitus]RKG75977.1 EamA family transporter [Corallococcus exercitus]
MSTPLLTLLALLGFAANSLLCRAALSGGAARSIDAGSFTLVRLASGALVLALLLRLRRGGRGAPGHGSWASALALFVYAAGFSFAYVRIGAGVGALLLFGCVQLTMLAAGLARGERPRALEWAGLAVALAGLAGLTLPGASAPDAIGAGLMAAAGVAWGIYSLRGRGSTDPLAATAGNFVRSVPLALALVLLARALDAAPPPSSKGLLLAVTSGALASGVGYSLWYAALPHLSSARAAVVQLCVPVIAAVGAVLLLGEPLTQRLLLGGTALLAGVLLSLRAKQRPPTANR